MVDGRFFCTSSGCIGVGDADDNNNNDNDVGPLAMMDIVYQRLNAP